jgi:hypothetical protein
VKSSFLIATGLILLPAALHADHSDFVVVSATASKAYTQTKFVNGVPKPETYVFYEGKYFGGLTRDPSIAHTKFMDIAKVLAPNLAKQNYLPTKNTKAADLLIVVNWGTTVTDETAKKSDPNTSFALTDAIQAVAAYNSMVGAGAAPNVAASGDSPYLGSAGQALDQLTFDLGQNQASAMSAHSFAESNAKLLGYTNALNKEMATQWASANGLNSEAESHLADLGEERYFVVLLAYDYQKILSDGKVVSAQPGMSAGGSVRGQLNSLGSGMTSAQFTHDDVTPSQPKPVWEVRINIRADGNNFVEALPAMSKVAADFFGKQEDNLKTEETNVGKYWVEVGPVKVISTGENPPQK